MSPFMKLKNLWVPLCVYIKQTSVFPWTELVTFDWSYSCFCTLYYFREINILTLQLRSDSPSAAPPPAPRFPPPHNIASSCVMLLRPSGLCRAFVYTSHLHTWRPNVHMHTIFKCVAPGHFLDPGSPALDSGFRGSCDLSREGSRRCSGRWIHWSRSRHEWSPEAVSCLGAVEGGSKAPRDL